MSNKKLTGTLIPKDNKKAKMHATFYSDKPVGSGGDSEIFNEHIDATDQQRNTALANVSNQTANSTTGKMGYKVLDPTKTFAEQVIAENTIYEIRDVFNLGGTQETPVSVTLPANSTLKFNGGVVKNCNMIFTNTLIQSCSSSTLFYNVNPTGSIANKDKYIDWFENDEYTNIIKMLKVNGGNIIFSKRIYETPYDTNAIILEANTHFIGKDTVLNIGSNPTAVRFFDITDKFNISFEGFEFKCINDEQALPPGGHGTDPYASSNIYMIYLNNSCSDITIKKCIFDKCAYGVKCSITSNSTYLSAEIKNLQIIDCNFLCDMPLQGDGYVSLYSKGCNYISLGTNSGNHAIYVYPMKRLKRRSDNEVVNDYNNENVYIQFDNCYFNSPRYDGTTIQFYLGDIPSDLKRNVFVDNSIIESYYGKCITNSEGAYIKCTNTRFINSSNYASSGSILLGDGWFDRCEFEDIVLYNGYYTNCNLNKPSGYLIQNDVSLPNSIRIKDCEINASSVIYDYSTNYPPVLEGCTINISGDCFVSKRSEVTKPLIVNNCIINCNYRICYNPTTNTNTLVLNKCIVTSKSTTYLLQIGGTIVTYVDCIVQGSYYDNNEKRKIGTTSDRPTDIISVGYMYFDTTLGKYICWNGTAWVNLDGTALS